MTLKQDRARTVARRRRGIAAIEFVMWLPLMMFLFWMVLAAGHIFLIHCEVTAEVRHIAWQGRHEPWRGVPAPCVEGPLPPLPRADRQFAEIAKVVRRHFRDNDSLPQSWEPDRGFLTAAHSKPIPFMIDLFADLDTARGEHAVLGGVWDYRELPFEDFSERHEHKRLEPSEKFLYHSEPYRWIDFSPLKQLASLGGGGVSQTVGAGWSAYQNNQRANDEVLRRKRREILRGIEQTNDEISRLERERDRLEADLRRLRGEAEPDVDAINRVEDQLDRTEDQLDVERARLAHLNESLSRLDRSRVILEEMQRDAQAREGSEA